MGGAKCINEKILLTLDCFKEFCLLAATQQSKKIYKYFIKIEKIIFKYMEEKNKEIIENNNKILKETINKLELKDKELEDKTTELNNLKNQKYEEHLKIGSIYVFSTDKNDIYINVVEQKIYKKENHDYRLIVKI